MCFIAALLSNKEEQAWRDTQRPGCEKHHDNMPREPWKQNAGSFLFIFRKDFDQNVKQVKPTSAFCFILWSQLGPAVGRPQGHGCTGLGLYKLGCPRGPSSWQILWIYINCLGQKLTRWSIQPMPAFTWKTAKHVFKLLNNAADNFRTRRMCLYFPSLNPHPQLSHFLVLERKHESPTKSACVSDRMPLPNSSGRGARWRLCASA